MHLIYLIITGDPLRIVNGPSVEQGRVEIYYHWQWSTICDNGWDDNDAVVVCKQLGYSGGSARSGAYFGEGTGSVILLSNVSCTGNESNIFSCNNSVRKNDCGHHKDAGVVCTGKPVQGTHFSVNRTLQSTTYRIYLVKRCGYYYLSVKNWCGYYSKLTTTRSLKTMLQCVILKSGVAPLKCGDY